MTREEEPDPRVVGPGFLMSSPVPESGYTPDTARFFERARALVPQFAAADDDRAKDWSGEDGPLGYIRVAALAWHLAGLADAGNWDGLEPILAEVEKAIESADRYTTDLMKVGLLEDPQNACLQTEGRVRLVDVRALLGPLSRDAWDELMTFWHGSDPAMWTALPPGSLPGQ